jgi:outer membrane protein assembly factor BamC
MKMRVRLTAVLAVAALALSGCTILQPDKVEYKSAGKIQPLEVPPDLTRPGGNETFVVPDASNKGAATYSAYSKERADPAKAQILPAQDIARIDRSGNQRWLVVKSEPAPVWNMIKEFWQETGLIIDSENPEAGVMETDWAEVRARIPDDSWFRSMMARVLSKANIGVNSPIAAATRIRFRTRLERGAEPGVTEVYISHREMEEVVTSDFSNDERGKPALWKSRPSDPEVDAEMLSRLMTRFGVRQEVAKAEVAQAVAPARAALLKGKDGAGMLSVNDQFDRAWRRVGLALDRVGFTVEDRDRSKGLYFVRYVDPNASEKAAESRSIFSKLNPFSKSDPKAAASAPSEQYRIHVRDADSTSQVNVLGKDGSQEKSETAGRILALLYEQLK